MDDEISDIQKRKIEANALREASQDWLHGQWGNAPRLRDRIAERIASAQYFGEWLRNRADMIDSLNENEKPQT